MKKLTLDVDSLEVETFDADAPAGGRGTVFARRTAEWCESILTGCFTDDACCGANTVGDACGTSGDCDDISVCWGTLC